MNDTRKDGRLPVLLVARYREPTMLEPREGECRDLSPSGMFITTHRPSPRGALIRFECVADVAEDGFRGTGRVVWQRAKEDARGPAGMGVRFVRLEAGGREALQRTLDRVESERRSSRVPRPSNKSPAVSRARIEEAVTQAVPIFAAGAGSSSSVPPAPSSSSGPPAGGAGSSRFPHLRSATLRGVGIPDEVKGASSNPPRARGDSDKPVSAARSPLPPKPDSDRPQAAANSPLPARPEAAPQNGAAGSPLPPKPDSDRPQPVQRSPLPPWPARGGTGSTDELRNRLDLTRRGVPFAPAPDETAPAKSAESTSDRPAASDATGRSATDRTTASETERAPATPRAAPDQASGRPPRPGGVDDLRPHAQDGDGHAQERPDFSRTTLKEVAASLRSDTPVLRLDPWDDQAESGRDPTERRIPIGQDRTPPRTFRASDPPRPSSRGLMWIVLGGGFVASLAVVRLFGTAPLGIPTGATAPPKPAAASNPAPVVSEITERPYVLEVVTEPAGARVSAAGQSVIAPGELRFNHFQPPLLVSAELAGYPNATASVWPSHFTQKNDRYAGHLELRFEGAVAAPKAAPAAPASQPSSAHQSDTRHESARHGAAQSRPSKAATAADRPAAPAVSAPPAPGPAEAAPPVISLTPVPEPAGVAHKAAEPEPAAQSERSSQQPLAQALDCLGRGDNRCVIRALEDKASSAREMELLIETYRAVGSTPRAERQMQRYLQRYPEGQRAAEYRQVLEHRAATPAPSP